MKAKLFYIQSPYYWRNLYSVSENLGIETYEILVDKPIWPTEEYDNISRANKIRLWNEERYGSGAAPHNRPRMVLGEGGDASWLLDLMEEHEGVYTNKIKDVLSIGDDVVLAISYDSFRMIEFFQAIQAEYNLRLHYLVWRDFPNRVDDDTLLLQYLSYLKTAASVVICNSHDFVHPRVISFTSNERNENWEKEINECNGLFLDTAKEYLQEIMKKFGGKQTNSGELMLYEFGSGQNKTIKIDEIIFRDPDGIKGGLLYESVTPGLNHDNCLQLKEYRKNFAEEYKARFWRRLDEEKCEHKSACRGTCQACDYCSEDLFRNSSLANSFTNHKLVEGKKLTARINGIDRMRINLDGDGVRSLILMDTCYLNCKHCINKQSINRFPLVHQINVMDLALALYKDVPYFLESKGGVTFGGGEPLLYSDYIHQFHVYVPSISINVETSLNVERKAIETLMDDVDEWIIDIKDMNPEIYIKYTDTYNDQVIENLSYLLSHVEPSCIRCRVPHIKGYNSIEDVEKSVKKLKDMGVARIETFEYK